jgi:hypothetical protein
LRAARKLTGIESMTAKSVPKTAIIKVSIVGLRRVKTKLRFGGKNLEIVMAICLRLAILLQSVFTPRREYPNHTARIRISGYPKRRIYSNSRGDFFFRILES